MHRGFCDESCMLVNGPSRDEIVEAFGTYAVDPRGSTVEFTTKDGHKFSAEVTSLTYHEHQEVLSPRRMLFEGTDISSEPRRRAYGFIEVDGEGCFRGGCVKSNDLVWDY